MTDAGDSASFTSVLSAKAEGPPEPVGEHTKLGGPPDTPPGLAPVHDPRGHGSGLNGAVNVMKPLDSVTAALPEAMRNLELPQLPSPSTENAALLFGDWLTVITPLMGDLSTSSREFWDWVQREVEVKYNEWLLATPLGRLRIKVEEQVSPRFQRLDQRASSTLLAALPEPVRKDIVASRRVATQAILYKLFTIYQPGGNAERGNLLRSLTEVKCGSSIQDTLGAIRTWRRWICRAEELHVAIPDSMVLIQALSKVAENLTKHGGSQVGFRIAAARQELEVDRRPTLTTTKEFAEFLQAEAEDLALTMPHPSSSKTIRSSPSTGSWSSADYQGFGGWSWRWRGTAKNETRMSLLGTTAGCKRGESCTFAHSLEAATSQTGVSIGVGRTTLRRTVHMVENDLGRMERRRPS